jgi:tetratricopeptide (TPR) repeat protein
MNKLLRTAGLLGYQPMRNRGVMSATVIEQRRGSSDGVGTSEIDCIPRPGVPRYTDNMDSSICLALVQRAAMVAVILTMQRSGPVVHGSTHLTRSTNDELFEALMTEGNAAYEAGAFDDAIGPFEQAMRLRPDDFTARHRAASALSQARFGDVVKQSNRAIEMLEGSIRMAPVGSAEWADAQSGLGIVWRNRSFGDTAENFAKAIEAFTAALTVHTKSSHPHDWAMTQNNLGNALLFTPTGDLAENIARAIACYEAACTVFVTDADRTRWAIAQHNLGLAWGRNPSGDRTENASKAIGAFHAALTVLTHEAHPTRWLSAQESMASMWMEMPTGERSQNLQNAILILETIVSVHTLTTSPSHWAQGQYHLALCYAELAEQPGQDECELLRRSIAASKGALRVYTRDAFPQDHADASRNLAIDRETYVNAGCDHVVPFDDIAPAE